MLVEVLKENEAKYHSALTVDKFFVLKINYAWKIFVFTLQQFIMYHEQATIINAWIKATQTHDVDLKVCILSWEWEIKYLNIYKPEIMFV